MNSIATYEGTLSGNNESVAYRVSSFTDTDGTQVRELTFDRAPYLPQDFYDLMNRIAPVPDDDIQDVKNDMILIVPREKAISQDDYKVFRGLAGAHAAAFKEYWEIMEQQGTALFNALPYRGNRRPGKPPHQANPSLRSVIGGISNKRIKSRLFQMLQTEGETAIVEPLADAAPGSITAPAKPLISVVNEDQNPGYIKTAALDIQDGMVKTSLLGATPNGTLTTVHDKIGHQIGLWDTLREPAIGISPRIVWQKATDGSTIMTHPAVTTTERLHGGRAWEETTSSVVGCMVLASLTPEVTGKWPGRRSYNGQASSRREQTMGPLQAMLLAVAAGDRLLQNNFIQHIEDKLSR